MCTYLLYVYIHALCRDVHAIPIPHYLYIYIYMYMYMYMYNFRRWMESSARNNTRTIRTLIMTIFPPPIQSGKGKVS